MERLALILMNNYREGIQRELGYSDKLAELEGPGILNWALKGYADAIVHPEVLRELPTVCQVAKADALAAMSLPRSWLAEETAPCGCVAVEKPGCSKCLTVKDSWAMFQKWCRERDHKTDGERKFSNAMKAAGYPGEVMRVEGAKGKTTPTRVRVGLTMSAEYLAAQQREAEAWAARQGGLRMGNPDTEGGVSMG